MENKLAVTSGGVKRLNTHISADILKALAMLVMLIDHIGAFIIDENAPIYMNLRTIGRLAFPIFCFLIAEGAYYTKSMPKYLARLAAFAFISSPPYNLVHGSKWYSTENVNVFFTLFLGLLAVYSISGLPRYILYRLGMEKLSKKKWLCGFLGLPLCALCYFAAYWMDTDYGEYGVAAILIFWLLRKRPVAAWLCFAGLTFVFFGLFIVHMDGEYITSYCVVNFHNIVSEFFNNTGAELYVYPQVQLYAPLAFIPCILYNGKKGLSGGKYSGTVLKYMFYAFYPVHLWCLWFVQLALK